MPTALEKRKLKENDRKKKFNKQVNLLLINYFKYVILFFFMLTLLLGYVFVVEPKYRETKENIRINFIKQEQSYNEKKQNLNNFKRLIYIYESLNSEIIAKVQSVLPKAYIKEQLFADIDFLITKNGYLVSAIDIRGDSASSANSASRFNKGSNTSQNFSGETGKMYIDLEIRGVDYFGLKSLLEILQNSLKIMDVTYVSFNPSSNSAVLKITTHYLKD